MKLPLLTLSAFLVAAEAFVPSSNVAFTPRKAGARGTTTTTELQYTTIPTRSDYNEGSDLQATTTYNPNGSVANGDYTSATLPRETTVAVPPKVAQRWRKSTKQVVTLGPASSSKEMIEKLFLAGADVFRLNFSHGSQEQKKELLMMIREVEEKYSHPIAILGDLQGPKLRVGEFSNPDGEYLEKGQTFRLDLDDAKGDSTRVKLPHPEIIKAAEVG